MKIKQTMISFIFLLVLGSVFINTNMVYADCFGVKTSIINCDSNKYPSGCKDGTDAKEGENPENNPNNRYTSAQIAERVEAYKLYYGHVYGKCDLAGTIDPVDPSNNLKDNGVWGLLILIINILSAGVGIAAVGGIVFGSILYTSSGGNPEKTKKAITMLFDILIGIVAWALLWSLLNYLIPGGLFS